MSLHIIIGKNKTGKSTYLRQKYSNENEKILFIPSEVIVNDMIYKESFNKIRTKKENQTPHWKILNFINGVMFGNVFYKELNEEEKEKIKTNKNKIDNFNSNLSKNNDEYFEDYFKKFLKTDQIQKNLDDNLLEFKFNFLNVNDDYYKKLIENQGSSGSLIYSLLVFLYEIFQSKDINVDNEYKLIIDEVEKFLHPELVFKIAKYLVEISKKIEVILTTHSSFFLEKVFHVHKNELKRNNDVEISYTIKIRNKFNEFNDINIDNKKLIEIIKKENYRDLSNLSLIMFSTNLFLTEGLNDLTLINDFINNDEKLNNIHYTVIDCAGKENVKKYYKYIMDLGLVPYWKICLFYDLDSKKPEKIKILKKFHKKNVHSIINKPDIENEFFEIEEIEKENKKKITKKIIKTRKGDFKKNSNEMNFTFDWILENSTKEDAKDKLKKIGKKINNFLCSN